MIFLLQTNLKLNPFQGISGNHWQLFVVSNFRSMAWLNIRWHWRNYSWLFPLIHYSDNYDWWCVTKFKTNINSNLQKKMAVCISLICNWWWNTFLNTWLRTGLIKACRAIDEAAVYGAMEELAMMQNYYHSQSSDLKMSQHTWTTSGIIFQLIRILLTNTYHFPCPLPLLPPHSFCLTPVTHDWICGIPQQEDTQLHIMGL